MSLSDSQLAAIVQLAEGPISRAAIDAHGRTINSIIKSGFAVEREDGALALTVDGISAALESELGDDERSALESARESLGESPKAEEADASIPPVTITETESEAEKPSSEAVEATAAPAGLAKLKSFAAKRAKGAQKGAFTETESAKPKASKYRTARQAVKEWLAARCGEDTPRALALEARDALADKTLDFDAIFAAEGFSPGTIRAELSIFEREAPKIEIPPGVAAKTVGSPDGELVIVTEPADASEVEIGLIGADAIGDARRDFLETLEALNKRASDLISATAATPASDLEETERELTEARAEIEKLESRVADVKSQLSTRIVTVEDRAEAAEKRVAELEAAMIDAETELKRRSRRNDTLDAALRKVWREMKPSSKAEIIGATRSMLEGKLEDREILDAILETLEAAL